MSLRSYFVAGRIAMICAALIAVQAPLAAWAAADSSSAAVAEKEETAKEKPAEKKPAANAKPVNEDAKQADAVKSAASGKEKKSAESAKAAKSTHSAKAASETAKVVEKKPAAPKHNKVRLAQFVLKDSVPESLGESGPFGSVRLDLRETISRIDKAADDHSIAGAVLDIRNPEIGRGKIYELRAAIKRFRAKGKKMYAQIESAMPADYLVACACDEISMPEPGVIVLPGVHAEATFYKGLLEKVGIQADFMHMGDFKGAAEPLTRENYSKPVRENMTSLVDSLYDDMVTTVVKDRPLSVAQVKEIIDTGLITAKQAKQLGLIDRVGYPDTLRNDLAESYDASPLVYVENYGQKKVDNDFSGPMGFIKLMQALMGGDSVVQAR